ncbi:MAG: protein-methionine-sulfoxide reductase catalytic subunit MsrP [Gammaproteobacteria bacterium]
MLIKKPADIRPSEITPEGVYHDRRRFLRGGAAAALGLAAAPAGAGILDWFKKDAPEFQRGAKLSDVIKGPYSTDETPNSFEEIATYNNFYEFGTGKDDPVRNAQQFEPKPWTIRVSGECEKPGDYAYEDFIRPHQLEERIYRFRCVEAWSMVIPWVGVPMSEVLKQFQPTSNAKYVVFKTLHDPKRMPGQRLPILDWPYLEGLRMDEAMHPLTLFVVGLYGEELPNQNGAPIRIMAPWKYGFKNIKSVVSVHFSETEPKNTWQVQAPNEYGFYANVDPAVSHPRWSQARERRIGELTKRPTLPFNGYAEDVAHLYKGMDPRKLY